MKLLIVTSLCATVVISSALGGPTHKSFTEEQFEKDVNYKTTLLSIEEKLNNIENSLSMQHAITIHGKIDYYGRKIDNIEKELFRFQTYMRMELDKISENISSKNYKDDITKDRVIRKIDVIYERINHKLGNIEGEIDLNMIKSQNGKDLIISKLDKIEENLTIRDADIEAELADAVAAIDDLKTSCSNIEESIKNITKETAKTTFKNNEKFIKKYHNQTITMLEKTNRTIYEEFKKFERYEEVLINHFDNNSNFIHKAKEEFSEYANEYANKIINMYTDISSKNNLLYDKIDEVGKISNSTKVEQQNALRALTVQVGRKLGKQSDNESLIANLKFDELHKNIDSKFDNIMLTQNLFLESCHRVQMDEAQLESQISIVLDKLIDIFENKTSIGPKDIHQLEHLIRTHDSNIRRSIHHVTDNLLNLMHQMSTENEEYVDYFKNQKVQLEALDLLLQDILISTDNSKEMQIILEFVQEFQQQLNTTHHEVLNVLAEIINKQTHKTSNPNDVKLQNMTDYLRSIYQTLGSVENKINKSYLDYYFNRYNVDAIANRFGEKLTEYINSSNGTNTKGVTSNKTTELIFQVFGKNPQSEKPKDHPNLVTNVTDAQLDELILHIFGNSSNQNSKQGNNLLCFDTSTNTPCKDTTNLKKRKDVNQTESMDCLPNYLDLIDVRSNLEDSNKMNCSLPNSTIKNDDIKTNHKSKMKGNCTSNYLDLIDIRLGVDPDCLEENITHQDMKLGSDTKSHNITANCSSNYGDLIDVRGNMNVNNCTNEYETVTQNANDGKSNDFLNKTSNGGSNETESNIEKAKGSNTETKALQENIFLNKTNKSYFSNLTIVQNADNTETKALEENIFLTRTNKSILVQPTMKSISNLTTVQNAKENKSLQSNIFLQNLLSLHLNETESKSTNQSIKSSNNDTKTLQKNAFLVEATQLPVVELNELQVPSTTTDIILDTSMTDYDQRLLQKNMFLTNIISSTTDTNLSL